MKTNFAIKLVRPLIHLFSLFLLAGCAAPPTVKPKQRVLAPGDCLHIAIVTRHYAATIEFQETVNAQGEIEMPLAGKVRVSGLTLTEARKAIHKPYEHLHSRPTITLRKCE